MALLRRAALALGATSACLWPQAAWASLVPPIDAKPASVLLHPALQGASLEFGPWAGLRLGLASGQATGGYTPWMGLRLSGGLVGGVGGPQLGWSAMGVAGSFHPQRELPAWSRFSDSESFEGAGSLWLGLVGAWPLWGERLVLRSVVGPMAFVARRTLRDGERELEQVTQGTYLQPVAFAWEVASTPFPGWPEFVWGGGQGLGIRWGL